MSQVIWTIGFLAGTALLLVTAYLIRLNWNPQLAGTLLSVLLGGIVTLFIAVFSQLKESHLESSFVAHVPIDLTTGRPYFPLDAPPQDEAGLANFLWRSRLHEIATQPQFPKLEPGQNVQVELKPMAPEDGLRDACRQLIAYKILADIRDAQTGGGATPLRVDGQEIPSIQAPRPAAELVDVPKPIVQAILASNPFHSPHARMWEFRTLRVPPAATIRTRHVPSSQETGITKDLIIIERPDYYSAVITLEAWSENRGPSSTMVSYGVVVSMKARFFKLAAGSAASANAKAWFEWLFRTLSQLNGGE